MAVQRDRPYSNFNFLVDLGAGDSESVQAGFEEVILPEISVEVIEYRNGNERESHVRKMPGLNKSSDVTLKRGVIGSLDLYQWIDQVRRGDSSAYRTVVITLLNEDRSSAVLTWRLRNAWPVKYSFANLNAKSNDTLIEELVLTFEHLDIE
jgi:phage tail-like protein